MSGFTVQRPIYGIRCDHPGCTAEFVPAHQFDQAIYGGWGARGVAQHHGWQTRPRSGKGSRTAPDFCPQHVQPEGTQ